MSTTTTSHFVAGKTISARSAFDHECVFRFHVARRTTSMIFISDTPVSIVTRGIKVHHDERGEYCYALGRYSCAPIFRPE